MQEHKEAAIAVVKAAPAWVAVFVSHIAANVTLAGMASVAAIVYSTVQTYISIQRYRRGR